MRIHSVPAAKNRRKFHKQIAGLRERLGVATPVDLSFLEGLPKFTGKDEPLPFPYGRGRGRKVGRSKRKTSVMRADAVWSTEMLQESSR